jgi:hypothetical protein
MSINRGTGIGTETGTGKGADISEIRGTGTGRGTGPVATAAKVDAAIGRMLNDSGETTALSTPPDDSGNYIVVL